MKKKLNAFEKKFAEERKKGAKEFSFGGKSFNTKLKADKKAPAPAKKAKTAVKKSKLPGSLDMTDKPMRVRTPDSVDMSKLDKKSSTGIMGPVKKSPGMAPTKKQSGKAPIVQEKSEGTKRTRVKDPRRLKAPFSLGFTKKFKEPYEVD